MGADKPERAGKKKKGNRIQLTFEKLRNFNPKPKSDSIVAEGLKGNDPSLQLACAENEKENSRRDGDYRLRISNLPFDVSESEIRNLLVDVSIEM